MCIGVKKSGRSLQPGPGAFNSDDWWFHTRMQGHHAWLQIGTDRPVSLRLAGFIERRDDVSHDTRRLTAELKLRLPEP